MKEDGKKGRSLNPRGGNDVVFTPRALAESMCNHFHLSGKCIDPCAGEMVFHDLMAENSDVTLVNWCEIARGRDFLTHEGRYDFCVGNPPWSQFRAFLKHAMACSDNIVFLANLNAWVTKSRMRDVFEAGFGYKEALLVDTPPPPWPQTGFQLAAMHIQRGYTGDLKFSRLQTP